jgi:hypothetical protein
MNRVNGLGIPITIMSLLTTGTKIGTLRPTTFSLSELVKLIRRPALEWYA